MAKNHFTLTSTSFDNNNILPLLHAQKGFSPNARNQSPELSWSNGPSGTQSYALVLYDPDAVGGTFVHWIMYNIPPQVHQLPEHVPPQSTITLGNFKDIKQGRNDYGTSGYGGPKPPAGTGTHRYLFTLYALDTVLDLKPESTNAAVIQKAIKGHVLAEAELIGLVSAPA